MTADELRQKYNTAYRIIHRERSMRQRVFAGKPKLAEKLTEMDTLLAILTELKDLAKPACEPEYEQPALLDVPRKVSY